MSRTADIVDPALKPIASRLRKLSGVLTGLDERSFGRARKKALAASKNVTVVLSGPLPASPAGFPGALCFVELAGDQLTAPGTVQELASRALLSAAERRFKASRQTGEGLLQRWRQRPPDPGYRKETGASEGGGQTAAPQTGLHGLLSGAGDAAGDASGADDDGFWGAWAQAAAGQEGSLDEHLAHVLGHQTIWFDPYMGAPCSFDTMLATAWLIEDQWRQNAVRFHCFGAQYWNHPAINATFAGPKGAVVFHEAFEDAMAAAAADGGTVLSWAGRTEPRFEEACRAQKVPLLRIEDGFIRSVGLGAGLARGATLAVDDLGIYYDPSRPSRLERLLEQAEVGDAARLRAGRFIEAVVKARVSKYNYGQKQRFDLPGDREIVLVPGQVADDAAVRKSRSSTIDCAACENVNRELLKLARRRNPEAFIIFKPHPDVETGLRKGRLERGEVLQFADLMPQGADIADLLDVVDRVETFSSLSGFEALLRGKKVTVHGLPFYAGWGLCEELTSLDRRTRQRELAELVHLAFFDYCRTIDPVTMLPCSPELLLQRLVSQRKSVWHRLRTTVIREISWLGRKLGL